MRTTWVIAMCAALAGCESQGQPGQPDDAGTGQPDATTGQPDATTGQPDATTGQPDATTGQPDATTGQPDATTGPDAQTGGPDGQTAGLVALSDEFAASALDPSWQVFQPAQCNGASPPCADITVAGGALRLHPNRNLLWYLNSQAILVWKPISGDFKVTAAVRARRASAPDQPPAQHIHLAGLMARSANPPVGEDHVFIVVGNDVDDLSVETKTTDDGQSTYVGPTWPGGGDAELRLCRVGAEISLWKRPLGGAAWQLAARHTRSDLPAQLQVGANMYAAQAQPDLLAQFDWIRFAPVGAGCDAD